MGLLVVTTEHGDVRVRDPASSTDGVHYWLSMTLPGGTVVGDSVIAPHGLDEEGERAIARAFAAGVHAVPADHDRAEALATVARLLDQALNGGGPVGAADDGEVRQALARVRALLSRESADVDAADVSWSPTTLTATDALVGDVELRLTADGMSVAADQAIPLAHTDGTPLKLEAWQRRVLDTFDRCDVDDPNE